ncbi:TOMM precursor leader peptide-binding protein [Saccharopolyspora cebuensis]|uniref:TOMM leader peptide-binding protein n=1 Tax=Saccharopolyspora cebuensis TaxID=418759 RepID=A0ABV4CFK1_9PSEU
MEQVKPKLKNDTLYLPSSDGIYFVSNRGTLTLEGKHVYQWVDKLAPFLTGAHTLDEITENLSEDRKRMVTGLIDGLVAKGFVKDVGDDRPHGLDERELAAYESGIAFIDYYQDSAAHRFEVFRDSRVLLIGSGRTGAALARACLHAGVREVRWARTGGADAGLDQVREFAARNRESDPRQTLDVLPDPGDAAEAAIAPFDVVLHVSDAPMLDRARRLNRACLERGAVFAQAVVDGPVAWIGPLVAPGRGDVCWECAWLRVLGRNPRPGAPFTDSPDVVPSEFLAGPTAAIVANHLAFEVFKHRTDAGPVETAGAVVRLDLETLQSSVHPVTAHPLCTAHGDPVPAGEREFTAAIRQRAEAPAVSAEAFSTAAAGCFDAATGLLGALDEGDFGQLPLKVSRAEYANAVLAPDFDQERSAAVEVSTDFTEARERTTRRACELYAASVVDRRRLAGSAEAPLTWGWDLVAARARELPAATAFPSLTGSAPSHRSTPGLASGLTWAEAVGRGLLAQVARITAAEAAGARTAFPRVDPGSLERTDRVRRFTTMLDVLGVDVVVHDITGVLGVPTFAARVGSTTVGCASGFDTALLLESVLEQALRHDQARTERWPDYAADIGELPDLPEALGDDAPVAQVTPAAPQGWADVQELLVRNLRDAGHRPVVVPLDHDPVLDQVLHLVNVVLVEED